MRRSPNVGTMLAHRRRRWAALYQHWVSVWWVLPSHIEPEVQF